MPDISDKYNYDHFKIRPYAKWFRAFQKRLPLGSKAPDFACFDIEGKKIRLSDYRGRFVVLEFGCMTCAPAVTQSAAYFGSISRRLVPKFSGKGVSFLMIYTREAHPGEIIHGHSNFDEKLKRARQFKKLDDVKLKLLVDSIDGKVHRAYGMLPNMAYIIDRAGRIVYKANWTDAKDLDETITNLLVSEKNGPKIHRTSMVVQKYRFINDHNIKAHSKIYGRGGQNALKEIREELGLQV